MSAASQPDQNGLAEGFVPFPSDRAAEYRRAGYWTGRRLDSLLSDGAKKWPQRTAIIDPTSSYSFGELNVVADRVATGLLRLGIKPGDRVLLQLPNTCQFAVTFFGLLRA